MEKRSVKTQAATPPHTACLADDKTVDARPEVSPYTPPFVKLCSKDGKELIVPRPLLRKCTRLPALPLYKQSLSLDVTQDVMHVFVHHLFTNTYQCLEPKGTSKSEQFGVEFLTAVRVYTLARKYGMSSLEELAKIEMTRLNQELHFSVVLSLVQSAYPDPGIEDHWLSDFFKSSLASLLQNHVESASRVPETKRKTFSVSELLLKCLKELADDRIILIRDSPPTTKTGTMQDFTFRMPIPQLGSFQGSPAEPFSDTTNMCEQRMTPQEMSEPGPLPVIEDEKEEPVAPPPAVACCSPELDEDEELATLEAKKVKRGKLVLRKDKERYAFLRDRLEQRAEEKAASAPEQAGAVADAAAQPAPECIEVEVPQVAVASDVAQSQALDDRSLEVALEEDELAHLEAKKSKKGKLTSKDRERYKLLKEKAHKRAEQAATESPDAPGSKAEFEAASAEGALADDVAVVDTPPVNEATATEVAKPEPSCITNPEQILLGDIGEHAVEEIIAPDADEAAAREDDWFLCNSKSSETNADCGLRAEHILGQSWIHCKSCRLYVDYLHQQLIA